MALGDTIKTKSLGRFKRWPGTFGIAPSANAAAVPLAPYNVEAFGLSGGMMPPLQHSVTDYAVEDGAALHGVAAEPRPVVLRLSAPSMTSDTIVELLGLMMPDRLGDESAPFYLHYYGPGQTLRLAVVLAALPDFPDPDVLILRFLAYAPYWEALATYSESLAFVTNYTSNYVSERSAAGVWSGTSSGPGAAVHVLSYGPDGKLYAGLNASPGLKVWNGSAWSTVAGGMNGPVLALTWAGTTLYVVGSQNEFSSGSDYLGTMGIWNGSKWSLAANDGANPYGVAADGVLWMTGFAWSGCQTWTESRIHAEPIELAYSQYGAPVALAVANDGRTAIGEMPRVTETPIAYGTPQAGSGGTIADGWLSAVIARVSQIPTTVGGDLAGSLPNPTVAGIRGVLVENGTPGVGELLVGDGSNWVFSDVGGIKGVQSTPAAFKVPYSDSGGKIADSWLNTTIARLTDLTWANISGKPSTFAPSAHAASHKHGGADEVATATPAANAIPKADAAGQLADGWLSANVALENVANTFTLAQVIQVTHTVANTTAAAVTYNTLASVATQAGFGQDHIFVLEADSGTNRSAGLHRIQWAVTADATRRARQIFYCYDAAAARECLRLEASGTAPMVSFNGVGAVARQAIVALSMAVGTGDDSVADVGTAFNQTTLNNNFRDLVNKVNAMRTILVNVGIAV